MSAKKFSEISGKPSSVEMVSPPKVQIDEAYQRTEAVNEGRINKIAANFDFVKFGVAVVGRRDDGSLWAVDGQHRLLGAAKRGVYEVPCLIFESSGRHEEARLFHELNKERTGVSALSAFKACVAMGEEEAVAIKSLLSSFGYSLAKGRDGYFQCASALRQAYQSGTLARVLALISECHQVGSGASDDWKHMFGKASFIQSFAYIFRAAGEEIDEKFLCERIKRRLTAKEFCRLEAENAGTSGHRAKRIGKAILERVYNHGKKTGRIDL